MYRLLASALLLSVLLFSPTARTQSYLGVLPAVPFPEGLDWINTSEPLTLEMLEGKIVLLDFWTYGCINCIHVIPDLQALEEKYADELVVIGVHSAKFDHEGGTENIRLVSERYDRTHPVVNDHEFELWRSYGIRAWPSFILIDPEGMVLGSHSGEGIYQLFDSVIASMIEVFDARGTLNRTPLELNAGAVVQPHAALRFPGGILADEHGRRLFIADSANHRIVVTDFDGTVLEVIGNGVPELRDGWLDEASFQRPHGMALAGPQLLYVADTGNHSIRLVDLHERTVTTVAGVGSQEYMFGLDTVDALVDGLNSPWDVHWQDDTLFIAMAGQHQLWKYLPGEGVVKLHAGSGREELRDGPLLVGGMNQPSGIVSDGDTLYVADSEASAIRAVDVYEQGSLMTVVGTGLFDFGDVDGVGDEVRLQHPKALALQGGVLYVADTYNNRIKTLDPDSATVTTLVGSGDSGWADGVGAAASFHEPGAISAAGSVLYVADTNNHAVRVIDLGSLEVSTLRLSDASSLLLRRSSGLTHFDDVLRRPPVEVREGDGILRVELSLPGGYVANHLAPLSVSWNSRDGAVAPDGATASQSVARPEYPVSLEFPYHATAGTALLAAELAIYYCQEQAAALCLVRQARVEVPVSVTADSGATSIGLSYSPPPLARDFRGTMNP